MRSKSTKAPRSTPWNFDILDVAETTNFSYRSLEETWTETFRISRWKKKVWNHQAKKLGFFTTTQLKLYLIYSVLVLRCSHICHSCFIEPQRLDRMQNTLEVILLMEENAAVIHTYTNIYIYIYTYVPWKSTTIKKWCFLLDDDKKNWWFTHKPTKESWLDFQGLCVYVYLLYIYSICIHLIGSSSQLLAGFYTSQVVQDLFPLSTAWAVWMHIIT